MCAAALSWIANQLKVISNSNLVTVSRNSMWTLKNDLDFCIKWSKNMIWSWSSHNNIQMHFNLTTKTTFMSPCFYEAQHTDPTVHTRKCMLTFELYYCLSLLWKCWPQPIFCRSYKSDRHNGQKEFWTFPSQKKRFSSVIFLGCLVWVGLLGSYQSISIGRVHHSNNSLANGVINLRWFFCECQQGIQALRLHRSPVF